MAATTKRNKLFAEQIDPARVYAIEEAIEIAQNVYKVTGTKFVESVDVSVNLGVDPRKSDQVVRGSVVLPHGTGKTVRVAVFTQGPNVEKAQAAGADIIGMEELAEEIKKGRLDFDVVIATPDAMRIVGTLGQVLGPRGLMPNPKVGTVTPDVTTAVKNAKGGQVQYRADKGGIVHTTIGKVNFEVNDLKNNLETLLAALKKSKPATSKGIYMKKLSISTTMGPGIRVDLSSLNI